MISLNVLIVGLSRVEKETRSVVTESVNTADTVVQQFGYDTVSWLQ